MIEQSELKKGYFKADPERRFYPGQLVKLYPNFWYFESSKLQLRVSDIPNSPIGMLLSMKRTGCQFQSWHKKSTQTYEVLVRVLLDDKIVYVKIYDNLISKFVFPVD
jgi:hypothetical protein